MVPRELHVLPAILRPDIRRVDDCEQPILQPLASDVVENIEGAFGRRLVVLVVGHEPAAIVGREHLGRLEVLAREGDDLPDPDGPTETTRES